MGIWFNTDTVKRNRAVHVIKEVEMKSPGCLWMTGLWVVGGDKVVLGRTKKASKL